MEKSELKQAQKDHKGEGEERREAEADVNRKQALDKTARKNSVTSERLLGIKKAFA